MSSERIIYNELLPLGSRLQTSDIEKPEAETDYEKKREKDYHDLVEEMKRQIVPYDV